MNAIRSKSPLGNALCALLLTACSSESAPPPAPAPAEPTTAPAPAPVEEAAPAPVEEAAGDCTYRYDPAGTTLTWTAFKLTERVGVSGTFDTIDVTGTADADAPEKVFEKLAFSIDTGSVNSENPDRDKKIVTSLFGTLSDGTAIKGTMKALGGGKGTVALALGGVTADVELLYTVTGDVLEAKGAIDLEKFEGAAAVAALNKVCEAQHTGEDKKSKLWPDVELAVKSTLKKQCGEAPAAEGATAEKPGVEGEAPPGTAEAVK